MKITERDVRLVRDACLSKVLSRDDFLALGYFTSKSRCNARLHALTAESFLKVLSTPFYGQHLYGAGSKAKEIVGSRIASLIALRVPSPLFVQHCLAATRVRAALLAGGACNWRFEQQVTQQFSWRGLTQTVRPDGYVLQGDVPTFLEVDLGHVALGKVEQKLAAFKAFLKSGVFAQTYGEEAFQVLAITTSPARCSRFAEMASRLDLPLEAKTFQELNIDLPGGWS